MQQLRQKLLSNALANIAQCFAKFRKHCEKKNAKLSQLAQSSHLTPCKLNSQSKSSSRFIITLLFSIVYILFLSYN